jgi:RNA polymerase sigma-70 factor (ECF subfamily)
MAAADHDLASLIAAARSESAIADRHRAFAEIVRRFQDLAGACAFACLRDSSLAEDAAQDAFLVAWHRLGQLRDANAFPGWIRRLVHTQCHRRLRCPRLPLADESEGRQVAAPAAPETDPDSLHAGTLVRMALAELGPSDRLVLMLSAGLERSHAEIARWLEVPVTTVSRRVAYAKRRLRGHVLAALSGGLRQHLRAVSDSVGVELAARCRRAGADDAASLASLSIPGTSARSSHVVGYLEARGFVPIEHSREWLLDRRRFAPAPPARNSPGAPCEFVGLASMIDDTALRDGALDLVNDSLADEPAAAAVRPVHPDSFLRPGRAPRGIRRPLCRGGARHGADYDRAAWKPRPGTCGTCSWLPRKPSSSPGITMAMAGSSATNPARWTGSSSWTGLTSSLR